MSELDKQCVSVKNKQIDLPQPIKQAGAYKVGVNVDAGKKAMVTVNVQADK